MKRNGSLNRYHRPSFASRLSRPSHHAAPDVPLCLISLILHWHMLDLDEERLADIAHESRRDMVYFKHAKLLVGYKEDVSRHTIPLTYFSVPGWKNDFCDSHDTRSTPTPHVGVTRSSPWLTSPHPTSAPSFAARKPSASSCSGTRWHVCCRRRRASSRATNVSGGRIRRRAGRWWGT